MAWVISLFGKPEFRLFVCGIWNLGLWIRNTALAIIRIPLTIGIRIIQVPPTKNPESTTWCGTQKPTLSRIPLHRARLLFRFRDLKSDFRMTLKNGFRIKVFVICFISQWMKTSKHDLFVFQPKKTLIKENQSNRSISVRLLFLFCSRVFISRSYENRSKTWCGWLCHFLGRDRKVRRLYYGKLGPHFFFKNFFLLFSQPSPCKRRFLAPKSQVFENARLSFRACGRTMMSYVIPGLSLVFAFLQNGRKQFEYVKYGYILFGKRSENIRTTERNKADLSVGNIYIYIYFANITKGMASGSGKWLEKYLFSQISGYVWTRRQNYPGCITGLVRVHHWHFWTQRSKQYLGEGFSVDLIQGPQVDFFLSDESRVGRAERALSVPLHWSVRGWNHLEQHSCKVIRSINLTEAHFIQGLQQICPTLCREQ